MRLFHLLRCDDPSGISGTGCVAEGVIFTSGWVAMTWLTDTPTITFFSSVEQLGAIHGHGGTTRVVFGAHPCTHADASGRTDAVHVPCEVASN